MPRVSLRFHPTCSAVEVQELSGREERAVQASSTADAVRLIAGTASACTGEPLDPMTLAAADRDRIMAAIYLATYGARVESTVHCSRCSEPYDLDFRLDELVEKFDSAAPATVKAVGRGEFETATGVRFRLPTTAEELDALSPATLAAACVSSTDASLPLEEIERAMDDAAPLIDLDLQAHCPECSAGQRVHFDIQSYLLNAILTDRQRLWREVHGIAATYHWSPADILGLPRSERRELAAVIENEAWRRRALA